MLSLRPAPGRRATMVTLLTLALALGGLALPRGTTAYSSHGPILIEGDGGFNAANGVSGGTGTATDPYIIKGWDISAFTSPGIRIRNTSAAFVIRNVWVHSYQQQYDCMDLTNVSNVRIETSTFGYCYTGISITSGTDVTLEALNVYSNFVLGIGVGPVVGLEISNTTVKDTQHGTAISVGSAKDAVLKGDTVSASAGAIVIQSSTGVMVVGNRVLDSGGTGVAFSHVTDFSLSGSSISRTQDFGIFVDSSSGATIAGNTLDSIPWYGMGLFYSDHVYIMANKVTNDRYGLRLYDNRNVTLSFNKITADYAYGVYAYLSAGLTIVNNTISQSGEGIELDSSTAVQVFHNNLLSNSKQALDNGGSPNAWDDGYPDGGNYWSDYAGVDKCSGLLQDNCAGGDGIGDTPYVIDSDSRDWYPLIAPASTVALPPTVGIFSPIQGETFAFSEVVTEGWASQVGGNDLARVLVRIDNGSWSPAQGTTNWRALVNLTRGLHTIQAQAWDASGNPSTVASVGVYGIEPGAARFTIVSLGTLGGATSRAVGINDRGQVVGESRTASGEVHAFLWSQGMGIQDLGTLGGTQSEAAAQNGLGQVVGSSDVTAELGALVHPFLWAEGHMADLGTLGGHEGAADDINNAGVVVGYSSLSFPNGPEHAFIWENGTMTDLGTLGGWSSRAESINDEGQVLGYSQVTSGENHPFLWSRGMGMVDLGGLGGYLTDARGLNGAGQVVGESQTPSWKYHAFVWQSGTITDLGTLGGDESYGAAIDDQGQVVGSSLVPGGLGRAFLYSKGSMVSLGTLGGDASTAVAINDRGLVVGESTTAAGEGHPFLWTAAHGMQDLGSSAGRFAVAESINNMGEVLGISANASNGYDYRAIVWQPAPLGVAMTAVPPLGVSPLRVSFTASVRGGLGPYTYNWDFGDGTTGMDASPYHTFAQAGDYQVEVVVTDSLGTEANGIVAVTVVAPLQATLLADNSEGTGSLVVHFTASVSGGWGPYSYRWDFGDGTTGTAANPTHTFQAGKYTVTLTVTDESGQTATGTVSVTVRQNAPLYTSPVVLGPAAAAALFAVAVAVARRRRGTG